MRKIIALVLLICISMCGANYVHAESGSSAEAELEKYYDDHLSVPYFLYTREEIELYCEKYQGRELFPDDFIMPEDLAYLGTMDRLWAGIEQDGSFFQYQYTLSFAWDESYQVSCTLGIYDQYVRDLSEATDVSRRKISSLTELEYPYVVMKPGECCYIKRGELYYVYYGYQLTWIQWEQNNCTFLLFFDYDSWIVDQPGDNFMSHLLSLEEEPFQKVQQQLLSIGNPNPPELEKPCDTHTYSGQWSSDHDMHWNTCQCGSNGNYSFHTDEDENGQCDTCQYQMRAVETPEPSAAPAQPTTPSVSATQPTVKPTQPTAKPTVPATEPTPAAQEPAPPATGMWIGIGAACAVVAAAVVVILLRKKKSA